MLSLLLLQKNKKTDFNPRANDWVWFIGDNAKALAFANMIKF